MIELSIKLTDLLQSDIENEISSLPFGESEISRLFSIRNKDAQRLSFAALLALSDILKDRECPNIKRSDSGKPYFEGYPLFFSLSHIEKIAVAVVCDSHIGVDLEWIDKKRKTNEISRRFFSPEEQKLIRESSDPALSFFSIWTKKEAYAKLIGKGLSSVCSDELPQDLLFTQYIIEYDGKKGILSICHYNDEEISIIGEYNGCTLTPIHHQLK